MIEFDEVVDFQIDNKRKKSGMWFNYSISCHTSVEDEAIVFLRN